MNYIYKMKKTIVSLISVLSFILGFYLCLLGGSYYGLQKNFIQTQKTLQSLFLLEEGSNASLIENLNSILYWNIHEYVESRAVIPNFISEDVDMLMCGNFQFSTGEINAFQKTLIKKNVHKYIKKNLSYCPSSLLLNY